MGKEKKRHWMESRAINAMPTYRNLCAQVGGAEVVRNRLVAAGYTPGDLYDSYLAFTLPTLWLDSGRQLFIFDKDAADMIGNTEGLPDLRTVLESVPYDAFAVDLDGKHGFFFVTEKTDDAATMENVFGYSEIDEMEKVDGRETTYTLGDGTRMVFDWTPVGPVDAFRDPRSTGKSAHEYLQSEFVMETAFMENIVSYICCKNADIQTVYKPPSGGGKRRRRSAATWHKVGFRIGAELRAYERVVSKGGERQGGLIRPHMRRAHWHHYWTGPRDGERKLVLKWVAPTLVAGGNGEIDGATGHRVAGLQDGE